MTLSEAQLWALVLILPSLVSGAVSSTVAFLLGRLRGDRVFGSFGWFALTLTAYGFVDGILAWSRADLASAWFVTLGFVDLLLMGALAWRMADLAARLLGLSGSPLSRLVWLVPLVAALVAVVLVASSLPLWTTRGLITVGQGFLAVVFLTALYWGARFLVGFQRVHDRLFRRILVATGLLLVAFVPLWLWDAFGRGGHYSFYWFLLLWNLGALVLASRAFFEPPATPPTDTLFTLAGLEACTRRFGLTPRESEIAGLHAQGFSARDIGTRLFIAPKTVRNHISNLYEKTATGQRRHLLDLLRSGT